MNGHPKVGKSTGLMEEMNNRSVADKGVNSETNDQFVAAEDNGLLEFVKKLMLSEQRAQAVIQMIVDDLKSSFKNQLRCEIVPFGSYLNGLCCVDSDVDVSLSKKFFSSIFGGVI